MRYVILFSLYLFSFLVQPACAQNKEYAKKVIDDLCSADMAGRGYVNEGVQKAADYIAKEYKKAGLKFFETDYFQNYGFPVIAFPYNVDVKIEDQELVPGEDFIVGAGCPLAKGVFDLLYVDSSTIDNPAEFSRFEREHFYKAFLVVDGIKNIKAIHPERVEKILNNEYKARGLIYANQEKLTWSVATKWDPFPVIYITKGNLKRHQLKITLDIQPEVRANNAQNVIGYIKGSKYPDSFIVFSAHYDHLGMMGKWAMFPGANDNASGVAMMLDIMNYYKQHPPKYSIVFIAFSGEEAGLFGSYYYTEHPLFPLNTISLLLNLDLMGTGDKGMTVVNATLFPKEFDDLKVINMTNAYLVDVKSRGKAQNSDHYYFSENGVKAFFFYLMGDYKYYHDIYDTPEALTLSRYDEAFKLITDFVNEYQP